MKNLILLEAGPNQSWFADFSVLAAWTIILGLAISIGCLFVKSGGVRSAPDASRVAVAFDDARLYEAVSQRVHRGEDYYDAAASELAGRGYPMASVFNWRMPVYAWVFGSPAGIGWGWALLITITLVSSFAAGGMAYRATGRRPGFVAAIAFIGSYGWVFYPEPPLYMELWSGLFIFLSCFFVGSNLWWWGVLTAAIALTLRELALPFVAIALLEALRRKKWGPAAALGVILATFLAAFGMHYRCVALQGHLAAGSTFRPWVAFGGRAFVLSASRMNYLLAMLPGWCVACSLPLSLLGLLGARSRDASLPKYTLLVYIITYNFLGNELNYYWGLMIMPLLLLGLLRSPQALRDLLAAALR